LALEQIYPSRLPSLTADRMVRLSSPGTHMLVSAKPKNVLQQHLTNSALKVA